VAAQGGFHGLDGDVFVPSRIQHGLEHGLGAVARLRLLDDPLPQLRRDLLCLRAVHDGVIVSCDGRSASISATRSSTAPGPGSDFFLILGRGPQVQLRQPRPQNHWQLATTSTRTE
jgi:hypothetical protein